MIYYQKSKGGFTNLKFILIPIATIGGVVIGAGAIQMYKEVSRLRQEVEKNKPSLTQNDASRPERTLTVRSSVVASNEIGSQNNPATVRAKIDRFQDTENNLLRLKEYIRGIEEKNALLKDKVALVASLLDSKEKEITRLNDFNSTLKENLSKTLETQEKLKAELESRLAAINTQLTQKDSEISILTTLKGSLQNQVEELRVQLKALNKEDRSSLEAEFANTKNSLKQQADMNEMLSKNIKDLNYAVTGKEKERQEVASELEEAKRAREEISLKLEKLQEASSEYENRIAGLNEKIISLTASYEDEKKTNLQLSSLLTKKELESELTVSDSQGQLAKIKDTLFKVSSEKEAFAAALQGKEKSVAELKTRVSQMESQGVMLSKQLALETERKQQASEQLSQLIRINNSLKERLRTIEVELEMYRIEKKQINITH